MRTYTEVEIDDDHEESAEGQGQRGLRNQSVIHAGLSSVVMTTGVVSVILMANNESFPAFTLSPVCVGLLGFATGSLGIVISRKRMDSGKDALENRNVMFAHYLLNVFTATLSCVGTVYSCISGTLCSGMEIMTSNGTSDTTDFCKPNMAMASVFAFLNAGLCMIVGLWSMRGICFVCYYGRSCGLTAQTSV